MSARPLPPVAYGGIACSPAIAELAERDAWVCWQHRADQQTGKPRKVPFTPAGSPASTTDPRTWSSFNECFVAAFVDGRHDGIGRVLVKGEDLVGIDLDDAYASDGLRPWANEIVRAFPSYWEASPSGAGLHSWGRGHWPTAGSKRKPVEVYAAKRFLTVTGANIVGTPETIERCDAALEKLWAARFEGRASTISRANGGVFDPNTIIPAATFAGIKPLADHVLAHLVRTRPKLRAILDRTDWSQSERDLALVRLAAREGKPREVAWSLVMAIRTDSKEASHYYASKTLKQVYEP